MAFISTTAKASLDRRNVRALYAKTHRTLHAQFRLDAELAKKYDDPDDRAEYIENAKRLLVSGLSHALATRQASRHELKKPAYVRVRGG